MRVCLWWEDGGGGGGGCYQSVLRLIEIRLTTQNSLRSKDHVVTAFGEFLVRRVSLQTLVRRFQTLYYRLPLRNRTELAMNPSKGLV